MSSSSDIVEVMLLGNPCLRQNCAVVNDLKDAKFLAEVKRLELALEQFRQKHGFGRAIAAPQIGVCKRFVACNLGKDQKFVMVNPRIVWHSEEKFRMFDDCMSFPWLLTRCVRFKSISVEYTDLNGESKLLEKLSQTISELFQHELNHLDGILCIDLAIDKESVIAMENFKTHPEWFREQIDYVIEPTIEQK